MIRFILLLCVLALGSTLARAADPAVIEAARKEAALAVASSAPGENFQKFMAAFKAKYPFLDITTGFYAAPTGRVLARVNAEIDAKRLTFDVMLAANTAAWIEMTRQNHIARYDSSEYAAYPAGAKMDGYWAAAQAIGVIPVYNKNVLPPDQVPKAWADLLRPEFSNHKLGIQNAAAGTQFNWTYLLEHAIGPEFIKRFAAQQPVVMATGAQLTDAVTRGEILVAAALDHWRGFTPDAAKTGLVAVYPTEGMPLTLAPVGMLSDAPHLNAAKLFVDFILSQEGQRLLDTDLYGMYSMRADVPPPAGQKPLAEVHPLLPTDVDDYIKASREFPRHFEELFH
jgi:iron(III) transport system substrate-binding protein